MRLHFNPLGRKTETNVGTNMRPVGENFNPLGRKTETYRAYFYDCTIYYFNPLGRNTETCLPSNHPTVLFISIHSVARPRPIPTGSHAVMNIFQSTRSQDRDRNSPSIVSAIGISIHSVARPRRKTPRILITWQWISIHSVARPRRYLGGRCRRISYFNPLGRKTETSPCICSACFSIYFNPLGRKTETSIVFTIFSFSTFQSTRSQDRDIFSQPFFRGCFPFQSTRSQDRDVLIALIRALGRIISIHSVARPRLYSASISAFSATFQSTRSQDRDVI